MSETFNLSTNQVGSIVPLPHKVLPLDLSSESHYSNSFISPSPDSSSVSYLSDREADSSPDTNILESCLIEGSPVDSPYNIALSQGVSKNQTFLFTPVIGSVNFWNENSSLLRNQERGSEKYESFYENTEDGSNSAVTSPDSAGRESQLSLREVTRRGSTENSCYSLSSGEMVIRSQSFRLQDESLLVFSSLEESSVSPSVGHTTLPVESNVLSTTLPDVCENSTERVIEENTSHPCLGMTFIKGDDLEPFTEENDMVTSNSLLNLPNENEGGLLMTFVCETSEDGGRESELAGTETEQMPHFPGAFTREQGLAFVSTQSVMQETKKDIHTSTPVQNIGNKIPSFPSFSESPCTGNTSRTGITLVEKQSTPVTPKDLVAGLPPSGSKVKKVEVKRFLKSDYSGIKSKVVTRSRHQTAIPDPTSQRTMSEINMNNRHTEATIRISPTKVNNRLITASTKMVSGALRQVNTGAGNLGMSCGHVAVDGKDSRPFPLDHPTPNTNVTVVQCGSTRFETEQATSSQVADASPKRFGNQTFCYSSLEKSPDRKCKTDPKPTPKNSMSVKIEVRSGSALGQGKPSDLKTRPRCSSESLLSTPSSRPHKENRTTVRISTSFTIPKSHTHLGQTKPGNLMCSAQNKRAIQAETSNRSAENSSRGVKKISLLAESSKSTKERPSWSENRFRGGPSPRLTREVPLSQPRAACHKSVTLSTCKTSKALGTSQSKTKNITGSHRGQVTGGPSLGNDLTASIKHQVNGSQPLQTPTRASLMGPPASRLPRKTPKPSRSLTEVSVPSELGDGARSTKVAGGAAHKPFPFKSIVFQARETSASGKNTQPTLTKAGKLGPTATKPVSNSTVSPLIRTASAKFVRLTSCGPVDKNKTKASSCQQLPQQQAQQPKQSNGPPDVVPAIIEVERKNHRIQQLTGLLAASNCKFEAMTVVLQQTLAEHDEATQQCGELAQELANLRGELVCSVHSSERLEKEKDDLRVALEDALQKLQEQHQKDLAELEQRLHVCYQAEWDKVHLTYQEEADKCKTIMQQQTGELKSSHEAMKLELQSSHTDQLQHVKDQYEMSLEELGKTHNEELQSLEKSLKDTEATLSGRIQALTVENNALIEKLTEKENKRKEQTEKSQKDPHTLYLEQELESIKVVLDIKNKQLHQQEKRLMEIDKLTEKTVKLDENLKKVQQENEDLKARMERHAALSRQLSTEQAVLQESLHKESKVNKRLSMENEELLWKLHNGDLSSPHKASPTSTSPLPSPSFSLQSPRSSSVFSSSLSPR